MPFRHKLLYLRLRHRILPQGYLTRGLAAIYFNDARLEVTHVTPPTSRRSRCGGQAAVPTAAASEAVVAT